VVQEDVDVLALSIFTSGHLSITRKLVPALREAGVKDLLLIMGGCIPEVDFEPLKAIGAHEVFSPGLPGEVVADYIRQHVDTASLEETEKAAPSAAVQ